MAKLSNYPRIGGASKMKRPKGFCKCGEPATHKTCVQFWYMRGDDEYYTTCEQHSRDVEFLTGNAKWETVNV